MGEVKSGRVKTIGSKHKKEVRHNGGIGRKV